MSAERWGRLAADLAAAGIEASVHEQPREEYESAKAKIEGRIHWRPEED